MTARAALASCGRREGVGKVRGGEKSFCLFFTGEIFIPPEGGHSEAEFPLPLPAGGLPVFYFLLLFYRVIFYISVCLGLHLCGRYENNIHETKTTLNTGGLPLCRMCQNSVMDDW